MNPFKAPNPDGIQVIFYIKVEISLANLFVICRLFFNHGHILKELNDIYITLATKTSHSVNVNHYKPITLCISYKVISEVLANKLKKVLSKIISPL